MIEKLQKNPRLKPIYEDVNFRRIIEDGKAELSLREITFTELTPEEQGYVDFIFSWHQRFIWYTLSKENGDTKEKGVRKIWV